MLATQALPTISTVQDIVSMFTLPSIGTIYKEKTPADDLKMSSTIQLVMDFLKLGFPIYADTVTEQITNTIGEQVLVGGLEESKVGQLYKVADNIVPEPRTWIIHGYMGFASGNVLSRLVNSIPILGTFIKKFGHDTLLSLIKEYIRYVSNARKPFRFYTAEGEEVPSLIKSCKFTNKAENTNYIEVDLEIREFRYLVIFKDDQVAKSGFTYDPMNTVQALGRSVAKAFVF